MMIIIKTAFEGLGLGALLMLICAIGIRKGAVNMVHFTAIRCSSAVWNLD